jgi:chaperonin cofactor prefoldin
VSHLSSFPNFSSTHTGGLKLNRLVIETLQEAYDDTPTRKCFRQIGGVLVERTVKDVLPELQNHLKTVSSLFHGASER